jgi:tetratricopeptide (TPR) repeat protein
MNAPIEPRFASLTQGLAHADAAAAQEGLQAALEILTALRTAFPRALAPTTRACALLREAGRLDLLDGWLSEARTRFPGDLGLATEYAREAQRRRDFAEAVRRWQAVRDEFPGDPGGYAGLAATLRESGQLDLAESVCTAALERFPDVPELLVQHASVAHARQDWAVAARRWEVARVRQPDKTFGYLVGAQCLRSLGQIDAAEALLRAAVERFPDDAAPLVEFAWTAHLRRNWATAFDRWEEVRARFPNALGRYTGAGQALRQLGRLDEAEALLGAGVAAFPNEPGPLNEYASLAHQRRDWPEAVRRCARLREVTPDSPAGYQGGVEALRQAGQLEAAAALLTEAVSRLPEHVAMLSEYASNVQVRLDWEAVARRCEQLRKDAPDRLEGYTASARALREAGQSAAAEAMLEDAMRRFPHRQEPFLDYADAATRRGDWDVALQRLSEARRRFPDALAVLKAMHEAELRSGFEDPDHASQQAPAAVRPNAANANADMREIVAAFASLGGEPRGCEFGEAQRYYGAEPLDLLRWTEVRPAGLTDALERRFEGIGDPQQTEVFAHQFREQWLYVVRDRRYGMTSHTYISRDEAPQDKVAAQTCRRMQYLRRKLIDDLEAANKVFVYRTVMGNLSDAELDRLHAAIRRYNNDTTLLYVRYTDAAHADGTVEVARPGLLIGYLDRFGALPSGQLVDVPFASWATLCRKAYRLWHAGATRGEADPTEHQAPSGTMGRES